LIKLNVSKNKIKNIAIFGIEENFANLKWLDLSNNKFNELISFKGPKLEYLDLGYNKIEKEGSWAGHPNLKIFKSVDNKFKSLEFLKDMPKLEEVYIEGNVVATIKGYETCPKLRRLHLRKNRIEKFEEELATPGESLQYINLRGNKVPDLAAVERLYTLFPTIQDINILGNPVEKQLPAFNLLISEVLIKNPKIKRFSKVQITDQHKLEAVFLARMRWEKSEEERKKKEEEEKAKAAAEGGDA
jgi:Leucine-rich repeat (LRR) protein